MKFEWNKDKNIINLKKHGISFEEAIEVFDDPMCMCQLDERYNYNEERWISLGSTKANKILVVANVFFDEYGEEIIRIISARKANTIERKQYESGR